MGLIAAQPAVPHHISIPLLVLGVLVATVIVVVVMLATVAVAAVAHKMVLAVVGDMVAPAVLEVATDLLVLRVLTVVAAVVAVAMTINAVPPLSLVTTPAVAVVVRVFMD